MGIDSILNWFKLAPEDEDYDDDFADDYVEEEEVRPRYREEKRAAKQEAPSFDDYDEPAPQPKRTSFRTSTNKVVPIVRHQTVWKYVLSSQVISESHSRCAKF